MVRRHTHPFWVRRHTYPFWVRHPRAASAGDGPEHEGDTGRTTHAPPLAPRCMVRRHTYPLWVRHHVMSHSSAETSHSSLLGKTPNSSILYVSYKHKSFLYIILCRVVRLKIIGCVDTVDVIMCAYDLYDLCTLCYKQSLPLTLITSII